MQEQWWQIAIRAVKSMPKKIKRSTENNLNSNGGTVASNDTFQILYIAMNKILKDLLQKQSPGGAL